MEQSQLDLAVARFESNPYAARRIIAAKWEADKVGFLKRAVKVLASPREDPGLRFLLSFLMQHEPLAALLSNPDFCTCEEAIHITRRACRIDRMFERQIAQPLQTEMDVDDDTATRILSILESAAHPQSLPRLLSRLVYNSNPKVRSKAALLVGRGSRNYNLVRRDMEELDPRVRANAVEALWGMNGPEAVEIFLAALTDPDPRVSVNGVYGLYCAGDTQSIDLMRALAESPLPAVRRSISWAMGKTRDPRFLPILTRLIRDPDATVRSRAHRSASATRSHLKALQKDPLSINIGSAVITADGMRQLSLSVRLSQARQPPPLSPLAFVIEEEDQPVLRYEVSGSPTTTSTSIGILFPAADNLDGPYLHTIPGAVRRAIDYKHPAESWAPLCYTHGDRAGEPLTPGVHTGAPQVDKAMELAARACRPGLLSALQALITVLPPYRRVLVIAGNPKTETASVASNEGSELAVLTGTLKGQRTVVHAVLPPGCSQGFEAAARLLTSQTGGSMHLANSPEEFTQKLLSTIATAHCEYTVCYWDFAGQPPPRRVHIAVHSPDGYGDCVTELRTEVANPPDLPPVFPVD